jgi:hypothetical protein
LRSLLDAAGHSITNDEAQAKKRSSQTAWPLTGENAFFARYYVKSDSRKPLPKVKISISGVYFSDALTMTDFINRVDHFLPVTAMKRASQFNANCWPGLMQADG